MEPGLVRWARLEEKLTAILCSFYPMVPIDSFCGPRAPSGMELILYVGDSGMICSASLAVVGTNRGDDALN